MTRLRRIADRDRIFFVTTNLARGRAAFDPCERTIILDAIASQHARAAFWIFAYVVMPDPLHLLLRPNSADLPSVMRAIKSISAREILPRRGSAPTLWQPRYFDNVIRRVRDFWEKVEYIHQNPVAAGLAARPEDWTWSSYRSVMRKGDSPISVDAVNLPSDANALLWPG
jgi:putative transposase